MRTAVNNFIKTWKLKYPEHTDLFQTDIGDVTFQLWKLHPQIPAACFEIAGLLEGLPVSRQDCLNLCGTSPRNYLNAYKKILTAVLSPNAPDKVPKLTLAKVAGALGAPALLPWAQKLVASYDSSKGIELHEQPVKFLCAFIVLQSKNADLFQLNPTPKNEIVKAMKGKAKDFAKDRAFLEALNPKQPMRQQRATQAKGDAFTIEIAPSSRSSSPVSSSASTSAATKEKPLHRSYLLQVEPFYAFRDMKALVL